jgi:hypothetical protein
LARIELEILKAHQYAEGSPLAKLGLLIGDAGVAAGELLLLAIEATQCW